MRFKKFIQDHNYPGGQICILKIYFRKVDIWNKSQDHYLNRARGQKFMGMNPIFITNGAKSASERGVDKMEKNNNKKNALIKTELTSARSILEFKVI